MASYHCTVKVGAKGFGAPHAKYISRTGKYSGKNVSRYEDLVSTGYGNMPSWAAHDPDVFWKSADEYERSNGAVFREIEVALPRELTPEQNIELVADFIKQEIGDCHAYQWAIHSPKASIEKGEQPHAHIIYSERTQDGIERQPEQYFKRYNSKAPEKGGCKKDSAGTEDRLLATRERWARIQNEHLEKHGKTDRVDHRSLKDRGIDRVPEKHIGPIHLRRMSQDEISAILQRRAAEGEAERAKKAALDDQEKPTSPLDLSTDVGKALEQKAALDALVATEKANFMKDFERFKQEKSDKEQRAKALQEFFLSDSLATQEKQPDPEPEIELERVIRPRIRF